MCPAFLKSPTSGFDGNGSRTSDTFSAEVSRDGPSQGLVSWTLA